jgi:hypothetical protein
MQQSPDHTDDIRLIEGSMMVICLFKLQSSNDASSKFKDVQTLSLHGRQANCLFVVAPRFGPTGPMKQEMQAT